MTGIYRYIRYSDVADRMNQGWKYVATLPYPHGQYSALMKWCCGNCRDGEAPE